ncbi:hypothetical protein Tco_1346676 [Tanacetum coccineum]
MTTLAEHMIVACSKNRPPMLEKSMYNSWSSRMLLYIKGKKNSRMMLESIENGPLVYPTIEENGQIRNKKYAKLTKQEKLQDDCDVQATNIVLQGLPPDVYSLVNHHQNAKEILNRVKLLMKGTELSYQERESSSDLSQHEGHAYEACMLRERYQDPLELVANYHTQSNSAQYQQQPSSTPQHVHSSQAFLPTFAAPHHPQQYQSLAVPTFHQGDDLIDCINKEMAFLSTMASRFPSTNNQLKTSSNPINQETIQDGGNNAASEAREKMLLVQAHESGQVLDEEQLAILADLRVADGQATQTTIPQNVAFQTEDLDAYDLDCDDISSAKAVLMANLSSCDSNVLSEVPNSDTYQTDDMINQSVQEMQYSE